MTVIIADPIVCKKRTEEGLLKLKEKIQKKKNEGKDYISILSLIEHLHSKGAHTLEEIIRTLPNTNKYAFYLTYNISFKFDVPNEDQHNYIYIPDLNIYLDNGEYVNRLSKVYAKIEENYKLRRKVLFDSIGNNKHNENELYRTIITYPSLSKIEYANLFKALLDKGYKLEKTINLCFYKTDAEAITYISTRSLKLIELVFKKE